MSFSSGVKDELSRQIPPARHCKIAETAAILSLCGRVKISGQDLFNPYGKCGSCKKILYITEKNL